MQNLIAIAGFGILGVLSRYGIDQLSGQWNESFPVSTFAINILGSLLAGTLYALAASRDFSATLQTGLLVGFCGGFTTFSAYALQTSLLIERGRVLPALAYLVLSPALGLVAALAPILLLRKA